ncbi:hypothetical protein vseg_004338 [Gypsophila vaccaria]
MKCDEHLSDFSSNVGVCASCLRDRLLYVIERQSQCTNRVHLDFDIPSRSPLTFPRSVSPYVSRRKSDSVQIMFYDSPQINVNSSKNKRNSCGKLRLFSKLIRHRQSSSESLSNSAENSRNSKGDLTSQSTEISSENEKLDECEEREMAGLSSPGSWSAGSGQDRVRPSHVLEPSMVSCLSPFSRAGCGGR